MPCAGHLYSYLYTDKDKTYEIHITYSYPDFEAVVALILSIRNLCARSCKRVKSGDF